MEKLLAHEYLHIETLKLLPEERVDFQRPIGDTYGGTYLFRIRRYHLKEFKELDRIFELESFSKAMS